ncbi:4-(cytidine 5'-diphospho)-2-C-methyl-D-erythritol kinase [soil metagenome]
MTPTLAQDRLLGLAAPAKINLFLHVTGRRADGLHELQTVFQFVSLYDEVDLIAIDADRIERDGDLVDLDDAVDLTMRAARLLKRETGSRQGARIVVRKQIPAGGGLGGGSSDAATVLIGLNRLWQLGLDRTRLATLSLELGADVPVFIGGRNAWAEGIGERLEPLELPKSAFRLGWPGISIATRDIFTDPELTRNTPPARIRGFSEIARTANLWSWLAANARNDLQEVAVKRYPQVAHLLHEMGEAEQSPLVRMSGSGSCCFAVNDGREGRSAVGFGSGAWKSWQVEGLDRHPLFDLLK